MNEMNYFFDKNDIFILWITWNWKELFIKIIIYIKYLKKTNNNLSNKLTSLNV